MGDEDVWLSPRKLHEYYVEPAVGGVFGRFLSI
jgi:hypothetical protein